MAQLFQENVKEICLEIDTINAVFVGQSDNLFVQEKVRYNKQIPERKFYMIQDLNSCSKILTRFSLTNQVLDNNLTDFKMIPFGMNYILMEGIDVYHIMKVESHQLNYIASMNKQQNSIVKINQLGNTIVNLQKSFGSLMISLSW